MKILKNIFAIIKTGKCYSYLIINLIIFSLVSVLNVYIIKTSQQMIDVIVTKDIVLFKKYVVNIIILYTLFGIADFTEYCVYVRYIKFSFLNLAKKFFVSILYAPIKVLKGFSEDEYIARFQNNLNGISSSIANTVTTILYNVIYIIFSMIYLFSINKFCATMCMLLAIMMSIIQKNVDTKISMNIKEIQQNLSSAMSNLTDYIKNISIIKTYNISEYAIGKINKNWNDYYKRYKNVDIKQTIYRLSITLLNSIFIMAFYIIGGILIIKNKLTVGKFMAFIVIIAKITDSLNGLFSTLLSLPVMNISIERILEVYNLKKESDGTVSNYNSSSQIVIKCENVQFFYDEVKILDNINLDIERGSKVAIVGSTGSGKSTLIKLFLKLYDSNSGNIYINGINISEYKMDELRKNYSYVSQENKFYSDTIKNNITLWDDSVSEKEINEVLSVVGLEDLINSFKDGIYTNIENINTSLSQGEKQRISIARGIIRNSPIMLLDEITSNLDVELEDKIYKYIYKLNKDQTVIVITHRLSGIKNFDKIFVIHNGRIVEAGSYKKLLEERNYFYNLINKEVLRCN